jgi:hypothetical protein
MSRSPRLTRSFAVAYSAQVLRRLLPLPLALAVGFGPAWSQPAPQPLGTVSNAKGLVTMSFGSQVATVQDGTPVFDGARFITSSGGSVELDLSGGCAVKLEPNQMVTVSSSMTCQQQVAAVVTLTDVAGAGGAQALLRTAAPLLAAGALAAAVIARDRVSEPEITPRPR